MFEGERAGEISESTRKIDQKRERAESFDSVSLKKANGSLLLREAGSQSVDIAEELLSDHSVWIDSKLDVMADLSDSIKEKIRDGFLLGAKRLGKYYTLEVSGSTGDPSELALLADPNFSELLEGYALEFMRSIQLSYRDNDKIVGDDIKMAQSSYLHGFSLFRDLQKEYVDGPGDVFTKTDVKYAIVNNPIDPRAALDSALDFIDHIAAIDRYNIVDDSAIRFAAVRNKDPQSAVDVMLENIVDLQNDPIYEDVDLTFIKIVAPKKNPRVALDAILQNVDKLEAYIAENNIEFDQSDLKHVASHYVNNPISTLRKFLLKIDAISNNPHYENIRDNVVKRAVLYYPDDTTGTLDRYLRGEPVNNCYARDDELPQV